ncbi:MAG: 2-polyprenylphenol 6-hydroxylase [Rhizobiales bacterium PAR1]|nr:MAG: 2-polyprenylphenol 6-hydroxylase [Rhizobiales bacterium PAR1]
MFAALRHSLHLAHVSIVLMREGVFALVPKAQVPVALRPLLWLLSALARRDVGDRGTRIVAALTRLGPSYVKLGQFLATRPDLVGFSLAKDLEALQDRMPPFPQAEAEARVAAALGKPLEDVFESFGPSVAAASIAQVHKASLRYGDERREVAVKVLRPGIEKVFTRDIRAQLYVAALMERFSAEARRLKPHEVIETLERTVKLEMDLRFEASALSEMAENVAHDPEFRVPGVYWEATARECLTIEWIDGIKLNDNAAIDAAGIDRVALARVTMQSFLRHALRDGFFHADMHPGNLFVLESGTLVAVDLGIMSRLGLKERRFLAEILFGFITRDYMRIAQVHFDAGYVPQKHRVEDFAQALRAVGEKIHGRNAADISMAHMLGLLFEITGLFDMATRTELVLLQKTMVVVEGVSRHLDPNFNMWQVAEPVIREWIERNLGPIGKVEGAGREIASLLHAAGQVPELVERTKAALVGLEARQAEPGSPHPPGITLALWAIAAALILIAIRLT